MINTMINRRSTRALLIIGSFLFGSLISSSTAGKIIGIDLGTSYSSVAVYDEEHVHNIYNYYDGDLITPSWVAFTDNETLIGEAAKHQAAVNPERTIFHVKRLIGRKFEDKEVQQDMKFLPYKIVNKDGKPYIEIKIKDGETKLFSHEEITAMILHKLKNEAEGFLGYKIMDAVVTVPAYFNGAQRQATKDAGIIAGLNVTILNEPTAAAIGYGFNKMKDGEKKNILVFDLGVTFDVSILTAENGVIELLATNGDPHLRGDDFDAVITEYFTEVIKKKYNKDISKDNIATGKLRREAERAKIVLSSIYQTLVKSDSIIDGVNISFAINRPRFEELNEHLFRKIIRPVEKVMDDAGLEKHQIDDMVLVGGSTRIAKVRQLLKDYFDGNFPKNTVNPQQVVAGGAAVLGRILSGEGEEDVYKRKEILPRIEVVGFKYVKVALEELNVKEKIDGEERVVKYSYNTKNNIYDDDKWDCHERELIPGDDKFMRKCRVDGVVFK